MARRAYVGPAADGSTPDGRPWSPPLLSPQPPPRRLTIRSDAGSYAERITAATPRGGSHPVTCTPQACSCRRTVDTHCTAAAAAAALAVQWVTTVRRQLRACGVQVTGWLPPRGVAAVIRSAFDPASDQMVKRRGGGGGDTSGGDDGLPSGVDPSAAGPMYARRAMSYYAHNDHVTRVWWIAQWPRSTAGAPAGFLQPLLLGLPHRHTVSLLFRPVPYRKAARQANTASSSVATLSLIHISQP